MNKVQAKGKKGKRVEHWKIGAGSISSHCWLNCIRKLIEVGQDPIGSGTSDLDAPQP